MDSPSSVRRRLLRLLPTVFLLFCFLALLAWLYSDIVAEFSSRIIGPPGDSWGMLFAGAWFRHRFFSPDITHNTWIFYPIGVDNGAAWEGSIFGWSAGVFNVLFSPITAYNALIMAIFAASWLVCCFVLSELSGNKIVGASFAAIFTTSAFFVVRSFGHLNFLSYFHLPLLILITLAPVENIRRPRAVIAAVAILALISITSWYHVQSAIVICAFWTVRVLVASKSGARLKNLSALVLTAVLAGCLIVIANYPLFRAYFFGSPLFNPYPFYMNNAPLVEALSALPSDYITQTTLNLIPWPWFTHDTQGAIEKILFAGAPLLILLGIAAVLTLIRPTGRSIYIAFLGLVFFFLSLGTKSPIPVFDLVKDLPIFKHGHGPARFGYTAVFFAWVFVALAMKRLPRRLASVVAVISLLAHIYEIRGTAIPWHTISDAKFLESLRDGSDTPVLELPTRIEEITIGLIPVFARRPTFSGGSSHTTYSLQSSQILTGNALLPCMDRRAPPEDPFPTYSWPVQLAYLRSRFNLSTVVHNRRFELTPACSPILELLEPAQSNENYVVYGIREAKTPPGLFLFSDKGIGAPDKGRRSVGDRFAINIFNSTSTPLEGTLAVSFSPLQPGTNLRTAKRRLDKPLRKSFPPGITSIPLHTTIRCTRVVADCIAGYIDSISLTR